MTKNPHSSSSWSRPLLPALAASILVLGACSESGSEEPGSEGGSGGSATAGSAGSGAIGGGSGAGGGAGSSGSDTGGVAGSSATGGSAGVMNGGGVGGGGGAAAAAGTLGTSGAAGSNSGAGGAAGESGASGSAGTGGAGGASAGGTSGTAGTAGGGSDPSCPAASATELAVIRGWLGNTIATGALPNYAYENIATNFPAGAAFDTLACSIAMSCQEFAPSEAGWLRKCAAVITSAIVAESSYNPLSVVDDAYSTRDVNGTTAHDPTIGLLQIRFSSTVQDYNFYGRPEAMTAIGCDWPAALSAQDDDAVFWATAGGTTYLSFMQSVPCNVGLATWYYLYNATGNGGDNAVWIFDYCAGNGIAGNMVVGLLSHLQGGNFTRPADGNHAYPFGIECCACGNPTLCDCQGCTGRVAALLDIGTSSARPTPDPFLETLAPDTEKYCR